MSQGITIRLCDAEAQFPAQVLRAVAWEAKDLVEAKFPGLGDLTVEVWDTTDFEFGRGGVSTLDPQDQLRQRKGVQ